MELQTLKNLSGRELIRLKMRLQYKRKLLEILKRKGIKPRLLTTDTKPENKLPI